jgi:hypothetical protein
MISEASQVISNRLLETLRVIAMGILLMMVIAFLKSKYDYEIGSEITVKLRSKGNEDRWRNLK